MMNYSTSLLSVMALLSSQASTAQSQTALKPEALPGFYVEWPEHRGLPTMIQVEKLLERHTTPFQTIEMYQTATFGNMMIIDDVIMLTERDNHGYHEMIAHVPLISHPNPQRVLIVGGGDGGTLTEVLKHSTVQEVVLCEIDPKVMEMGAKYFPAFAPSFKDPRTTIMASDASQYIKEMKNSFDVIIVDSTDPAPGTPGAALFEREFYQDVYNALTEDGIAVTQSEPHFLYTDFIADLYAQNSKLFPYVKYYFTLVPTYPSGTIGFSFCSKKWDEKANVTSERISALSNLSYYHEGMHAASFQLPQFMKARLK